MALTILGIESSCDDTSAAVLRDTYLLSNVMASQEVHRRYGGVIPELASRAHQQNILPVVSEALRQAEVTLRQVDAIAFTRGPGLLGSLLVGTSFTKGLAAATGKPIIEVNHLQGHILSHFVKVSGRENRTLLETTDLSRVVREKQLASVVGDFISWGMKLSIPASLFGMNSFEGVQIRGNLYKCGDKTKTPHYLSAFTIKTEKPDFHRPEFFDILI